MRILMIAEFFTNFEDPVFSGGVETRVFYTAKHLAGDNKVIVLSRRRKKEKIYEKREGLEIFRLGRPVKSSVASAFSLLDRLMFVYQSSLKGLTIQADLVEGSNYVTFLQTYLVGVIKRIPKLAWYPDVLIGQWQKYFGIFLGFLGELGERVFLSLSWDQVITISESAENKLIKNGVKPNKITVISCGVEKSKFVKKPLKFKNPTLVVISRLLAYKQVDKVISALNLLKKDFPEIKLVVIGEGPERKKLEKQILALGLKKSIKFYQQLPESKLIEILAKSQTLVHPSIIEGFGIVLVEAAAVGTPFVAANIPTSASLAKKLNSGIIVKQKNSDKIAQAIKKLLKDNHFYLKKQKAGIINAKKFFWEKLTQETKRVYEKILI